MTLTLTLRTTVTVQSERVVHLLLVLSVLGILGSLSVHCPTDGAQDVRMVWLGFLTNRCGRRTTAHRRQSVSSSRVN